jgi:hypothetical protein
MKLQLQDGHASSLGHKSMASTSKKFSIIETSTAPERSIGSPSDPTTATTPAGARESNECPGHHAPIAHRFIAPGAGTIEMGPFLK